MWRAWGILLILVSSQDPGPPYVDEESGFSIRSPAGWSAKSGVRPAVLRIAPRDKTAPPCEIIVVHTRTSNPIPLKGFMAQVRDHVGRKYKGAKIDEEKDLTMAGRPAVRIAFVHGTTLHVQTVVHRSNQEYFRFDASMAHADAPALRPAIERSIASLEFVDAPLTSEERAAHARFVLVLAGAKPQPALLGEQWHAIYLGVKKVGHQRVKVSEAGGRYAFEADVTNDFGEGGRDATLVRGSFSPDGKFQKVDLERTKTGKEERWQFSASATLELGKVKVARDMNGLKEEAAFDVEEGVVFDDVADVLRRVLAGAGKGTFLMMTLSPFVDAPRSELVEVNDREQMEIGGRKQDACVVFSRVERRRNMTYFYAPDRTMIRQGGVKDLFSIRAASKDEALKP